MIHLTYGEVGRTTKRILTRKIDLSSAIKFIINNDVDDNIFNIGSGDEVSIKSVAKKY